LNASREYLLFRWNIPLHFWSPSLLPTFLNQKFQKLTFEKFTL
jgi:hypothetical protein